MTDLFKWAAEQDGTSGPCGSCRHLNPKPIDSGIQHCGKYLMWRWASEVVGCGDWSPVPSPSQREAA